MRNRPHTSAGPGGRPPSALLRAPSSIHHMLAPIRRNVPPEPPAPIHPALASIVPPLPDLNIHLSIETERSVHQYHIFPLGRGRPFAMITLADLCAASEKSGLTSGQPHPTSVPPAPRPPRVATESKVGDGRAAPSGTVARPHIFPTVDRPRERAGTIAQTCAPPPFGARKSGISRMNIMSAPDRMSAAASSPVRGDQFDQPPHLTRINASASTYQPFTARAVPPQPELAEPPAPVIRWRGQVVQPHSPFYETLLAAAIKAQGGDIHLPHIAPPGHLSRAAPPSPIEQTIVPQTTPKRARKRRAMAVRDTTRQPEESPWILVDAQPDRGRQPRQNQPLEDQQRPPSSDSSVEPISQADLIRNAYRAQQQHQAEALARARRAEEEANEDEEDDGEGGEEEEDIEELLDRLAVENGVRRGILGKLPLDVKAELKVKYGKPVLREVEAESASGSTSESQYATSTAGPRHVHPIARHMSVAIGVNHHQPARPLSPFSHDLATYRFPAPALPKAITRQSQSYLSLDRQSSIHTTWAISGSADSQHDARPIRTSLNSSTQTPLQPIDIASLFRRIPFADPIYPLSASLPPAQQLAELRASLMHAIFVLHLLIASAELFINENNDSIYLLGNLEAARRTPGVPESRAILDHGLPLSQALHVEAMLKEWWTAEGERLNCVWQRAVYTLNGLIGRHQSLVESMDEEGICEVLANESGWGAQLKGMRLEEMAIEWVERFVVPSPVDESFLMVLSSKLESTGALSSGTFKRFNDITTEEPAPEVVDRIEMALLGHVREPVREPTPDLVDMMGRDDVGLGPKEEVKKRGIFAGSIVGMFAKASAKAGSSRRRKGDDERRKGETVVYGYVDNTVQAPITLPILTPCEMWVCAEMWDVGCGM